MIKWKKSIALIMVLMMLGSALAGCGNTAAAPDDSATVSPASKQESATAGAEAQKKDSDEVVEITYWDVSSTDAKTAALQQIIEKFEAENPDIKINYVPHAGKDMYTKLDAAIQSNTTPDCSAFDQLQFSSYLVQDPFVALDDAIAAWDGKDKLIDIYQNDVKSMSVDGKTYAMTIRVTLPALWINTKMVNEAGAQIPKTMMDAVDLAVKLTDQAKSQYGFSIRGGSGSTTQLEQTLYLHSGITEMFDENGKSTINDPAHVEFLEAFADLYMKATPESDLTNGYAEMVATFDSGTAAMIVHNFGSYGEHLENLGEGNFTAVAAFESAQGTEILAGNGATLGVVYKSSEHPEEAFRWISYLNGHYANSFFCEQFGSLPLNKDALQDEWVANAPHLSAVADKLIAGSANLASMPIYVIGYSSLHTNELEAKFQQVLIGELSAKDFLDGWADSMTQLKSEYDAYLNK